MDSSTGVGVTIGAVLNDHILTIQIVTLLVIILAAVTVILINRQLTVKRLRESERAFRDLYDHVGEGVFRSTLDGRMISANPYLVRLNGFESEAEMLAAVTDIGGRWYVDPERRAEIAGLLEREGQITGLVSEVYRYKTRERVWVEENTRLVRDPKTGAPLYYDGTLREVTETVRRLDLQRRYDQIASAISGCIFQMRVQPDSSASMPYASPGLEALFGVSPNDVLADTTALAARIHPDDRSRVVDTLRHCRLTQSIWQLEFRTRVPGKPERWIFAHAFPEREPEGATLWHGFLTDVTERKEAEGRIHRLAFFDSLTGLPNRSRILEELRDLPRDTLLRSRWNALLFIDLDQFKLLNDTKGHNAGDNLLREIAERLRRFSSKASLIGRYGGDEFVMLLQYLGSDRRAAEVRVQRIAIEVSETLAVPFSIDDASFETTASIGIAFFAGDADDVDEILKEADLAMYRAKAAGGGRIRFFEPAMKTEMEERIALRRELRQAFGKNELALVFQPQVDDRYRCVGAEALLRWRHPVRGELRPPSFLPMMEPSGLGAIVDAFVLRTACATLRQWQDTPATRGLRLSVNITAHQLSRPEFLPLVADALAEAGADPALLTLELTEQVMLDDVVAVSAAMERLKAMGVRLALDDFGTGYSSLTHLRQLPLDIIKIDRSFVRDIDTNSGDRAIVRTVLGFAESFGLSVIAEGVETTRQLEVLLDMKCHLFQGYLFARPMTFDAFVAFAAQSPAAREAALERVP